MQRRCSMAGGEEEGGQAGSRRREGNPFGDPQVPPDSMLVLSWRLKFTAKHWSLMWCWVSRSCSNLPHWRQQRSTACFKHKSIAVSFQLKQRVIVDKKPVQSFSRHKWAQTTATSSSSHQEAKKAWNLPRLVSLCFQLNFDIIGAYRGLFSELLLMAFITSIKSNLLTVNQSNQLRTSQSFWVLT